MNYIKLINNFWELNAEHSLSGNETKLYFYLLKVSNSLAWQNPMYHSKKQMVEGLKMSWNTIKKARIRLKEADLINFKEGTPGIATTENTAVYQLTISSKKTGSKNDTCTESKIDSKHDTGSKNEHVTESKIKPETGSKTEHINKPLLSIKLKENKQRKKVKKENPPVESIQSEEVQTTDISPNQIDIYEKLEKEKEAAKRNIVVLPFDSERFANKWIEWVEARVKEKKQKPYTQTGEQRLLNTIKKYDEEFVLDLIETSLNNTWTGFYFGIDTDVKYQKYLKNKTQNQNGKSSYNQTNGKFGANDVRDALAQIDAMYGQGGYDAISGT